jgi:hypothetical protein
MEQTMSPLLSGLLSLVLADSPRSSRRPRHRPEVRRRVAPRRLYLEALEDRTLLSAVVSPANASLNEIGNVSAFVACGSGGLSSPKDLALGPYGNIGVHPNPNSERSPTRLARKNATRVSRGAVGLRMVR